METLVVEGAGCESCGALLRDVLEETMVVHDVTVDEAADTATITVTADRPIDADALNGVLAEASAGTGHTYRLRA